MQHFVCIWSFYPTVQYKSHTLLTKKHYMRNNTTKSYLLSSIAKEKERYKTLMLHKILSKASETDQTKMKRKCNWQSFKNVFLTFALCIIVFFEKDKSCRQYVLLNQHPVKTCFPSLIIILFNQIYLPFSSPLLLPESPLSQKRIWAWSRNDFHVIVKSHKSFTR